MFWNSRRGSSGKSPVRLENEIKQLQLNIITLTDQLENFKKVCRKYQEEYNNLVKRVNMFCRMILEAEYAKNQLGGNNPLLDMDVFTLLNYTEQCYHRNNIRERDLIIDLTNKLKEKEQEIEGLKAQISRYMLKEQQLKELSEMKERPEEQSVSDTAYEPTETDKHISDIPNTDSMPSFATAANSPGSSGIMKISIIEDDEDEEDIVVDRPDNIPSGTSNEQKDSEENKNLEQNEEKNLKMAETSSNIISKTEAHTTKNNGIIAHVIDLNEYISKLNNIMWEIIIAIGKKGLSESKDLKKEVVKDGITESAFNTALSQLRKMNLVEQEKFNTGWRWFYAYELSDLGSKIYFEKFKQDPVLCEKQILQREHSTALHGYCIKDAAYILKSVFGYDEAIIDRKMNSMKLYNGEIYIPDIIAKKKQGAITDFFEVELGHHTQKDFSSKCDKMRMVTKNLYFIVPDADTMNKILVKQISQWVLEKGGKEKLKGLTIYLTTMTKLSEGKWDNIYRF